MSTLVLFFIGIPLLVISGSLFSITRLLQKQHELIKKQNKDSLEGVVLLISELRDLNNSVGSIATEYKRRRRLN